MGQNIVPVVAILAGIGFAAFNTWARMRTREFQHRERLAMIDKGLTPPQMPSYNAEWQQYRCARRRGLGILLIFLGLGVAGVIRVGDGSLERGLAVGGLISLIGIAMLINSAMDRRAAGPGPGSLPPGEPRPPMTN